MRDTDCVELKTGTAGKTTSADRHIHRDTNGCGKTCCVSGLRDSDGCTPGTAGKTTSADGWIHRGTNGCGQTYSVSGQRDNDRQTTGTAEVTNSADGRMDSGTSGCGKTYSVSGQRDSDRRTTGTAEVTKSADGWMDRKMAGRTCVHGKRRKWTIINKIINNGQTFTNAQGIANCMNQHFCEIGKKLQEQIRDTGDAYKRYLHQTVTQTIYLMPVTPEELSREIQKLNPRKAAGYDDIGPKVLKLCPDIFAEN